MSLYYTTIDGNTTGRASNFFRTKENAEALCEDQNCRAENMGIKARYTCAEHDGEGISAGEIRD